MTKPTIPYGRNTSDKTFANKPWVVMDSGTPASTRIAATMPSHRAVREDAHRKRAGAAISGPVGWTVISAFLPQGEAAEWWHATGKAFPKRYEPASPSPPGRFA
jgi:hypothetical protein